MRKFLGISLALALGLTALVAVPAFAASGQPNGQSADACHLLAEAYVSQGAGDVTFSGKYNVGNPEQVTLAGDCDGGPIALVDDDLALDVSRPNGWSASDNWVLSSCGNFNAGSPALDVTDLFKSGTHTVDLTVVDTCGGLTALVGDVYLIVEQHVD